MFRTSLILLFLAGCTCGDSPEPVGTAPELVAAPASPPSDGTLAWADALAAVDTRLEVHSKRDDQLHQATAADFRLLRARLTGSYDDYAAAEAHVNRAFELAPEGAGPFLTRAALNYTLHRLDRVEADLDAAAGAVLVDKTVQSNIALARGKLRFHQGRYEEAGALILEAMHLRISPQPQMLGTLALLRWRTGHLDEADGLYADALDATSTKPSETRAWLHLQRGLLDLDRGRYADALAHYQDADSVLSGWYLVDEHIAEIYTLTGREADAQAIYERVAASTQSPEFFDALAGMVDEPAPWIAKSRAAYEAQVARFPEAAYGHALGHFLEFGPAERALELAEANVKARAYGGALTSMVEAKLAVEDAEGAASWADRALASGWRTADLHAAAFEAYQAQGRTEDAAAQKAAALAINPRIFE